MPDSRSAFLDAIRTREEDDRLRWEFADWLETHGESEFAQFIRIEIERDQIPKTDPKWQQLQDQAKLFGWSKRAPWHHPGVYCQTRRGFPMYINSPPKPLRESIERIGPYAVRPIVLLYSGSHPDSVDDAEIESGDRGENGTVVRELFQSRWVREWSDLEIHSFRITEQRARWMTEPGNLAGLNTMALQECAEDEAIRVLCHANMTNLKIFGIIEAMRSCGGYSPVTSASVDALIESPILPQLEGLVLMGHFLNDESLTALARSPNGAGIKLLQLWPKPGSWAGLKEFLQSPHWSGLTRLDISSLLLESEIVSLLANAETLPQLQKLVILSEGNEQHQERLRSRFGSGLILDGEGEGE